MKLTPLDIKKQEFTRTLRGYDADEVQAFLDMMAAQWDSMLDENRQMEQKARDAESKLVHYQQVEMALQQALQTAKQSSKQALDHAQRQAKMILQEAETKASSIKQNALKERDSLQYQAEKLKVRRDEVVAQLRAFLMSEVEFLSRFEGTEMRSHRLLQSQMKDESDDEEPAPGAVETAEFEVEEPEELEQPLHDLAVDAAIGTDVAFEAMQALEFEAPTSVEEEPTITAAEEEEIGWYFGEEDGDDFTDPLLEHIAQAGESDSEELAVAPEAPETTSLSQDFETSSEGLLGETSFDEPTFHEEQSFEHTITFEEPDAFSETLEDLTEDVPESQEDAEVEMAVEEEMLDVMLQAEAAIAESNTDEDLEILDAAEDLEEVTGEADVFFEEAIVEETVVEEVVVEEVVVEEVVAEAVEEEVAADEAVDEAVVEELEVEAAGEDEVVFELPADEDLDDEVLVIEDTHDEALSFDFFEDADDDAAEFEALFVEGEKIAVDHETADLPIGEFLVEEEREEEGEEIIFLEDTLEDELEEVVDEEEAVADEIVVAEEEDDKASEKAGALAGWLVESALSSTPKEQTTDVSAEAEGDGAQAPKKAPSAHQAASDEIEKIRRILNDLE